MLARSLGGRFRFSSGELISDSSVSSGELILGCAVSSGELISECAASSGELILGCAVSSGELITVYFQMEDGMPAVMHNGISITAPDFWRSPIPEREVDNTLPERPACVRAGLQKAKLRCDRLKRLTWIERHIRIAQNQLSSANRWEDFLLEAWEDVSLRDRRSRPHCTKLPCLVHDHCRGQLDVEF